MSAYKNLKPHVRVVEFLGGTGDGKTEIATVPASPKARKVLYEGVGKTNSTLTERLMVFTTEYEDRMVVAVKQENGPFSRNHFTEIVAKAIATVVKTAGKLPIAVTEKDEIDLREALREELNKKNNVKAVLSLLYPERVDKFIDDLAALYHNYNWSKNNYNIYNTVKNELADNEVKENSKKFLSALQSEVAKVMDSQSEDFKKDLWAIWEDLNNSLASVFFKYFDRNALSDDGYYYKDLLLELPDHDFIKAMFTANNIQAGEKLSLEVLCSEIVIYVPMNPKFSTLISSHPLANKVFRDNQGNIVFGTLDTRGLYHSDHTDDENTDYASELVYKGDIDSIAMVVPLAGDSNEKRISELYRDLLKDFNKQIPVFMIHNKLDLFLDELLKMDYDDPLSTDAFDPTEFTETDMLESIADREMELNEDLKEAQAKAKKRLPVESLVCYLKRDASFPREFVEKYNVLKAYEHMLIRIAESLEESADKIRFSVKAGEEVTPVIDSAELAKLVHVHVTDNSTDKKVFAPGMADIALSLGKTPHGNGYNAMRRRIKKGDGYTSNIDEGYFYNCNSFDIRFTANLRNFVSPEFIHSVVFQALTISGVDHTQADYEAFMKYVENYVNAKDLVSLLLYDRAILNAEKTAFSFKGKFQNFLQNSMLYFNKAVIDEEALASAVTEIVTEAALKALDLNVILK